MYTATPTDPVDRAIMVQSWNELSFLHWPFEPEAVAAVLPPGLVPDLFEGSAWVGLVPFKMNKIRMPMTPSLPWLSSFPETNIRTYVRGPNGTDGVFFLSLDITRLVTTIVARTTYRLPYVWSQMTIQRSRGEIRYASERRWPSTNLKNDPVGDATSDIAISIGEAISPVDLTQFDHYLTGRWGLWTELRRGLSYAPVDHPAWSLHRASARQYDNTLFTAAGLPQPEGPPVVHYSPGVTVRIGLPQVMS